MLASTPIESDTTFHFLSLQSVGDHSHVQRTDEGGIGDAVTLLGAAALVVVGYVIGGVATSGTVASTADQPLPVDIGGGAAKVTPAHARAGHLRAGRPGRRRVPPRPGQRPGPRRRPRDDPGTRGGRVPPRPGQSAADRRRRSVTVPASGAG